MPKLTPFFRYTYILGANGSESDRQVYLTVHGSVCTWWGVQSWVRNATKDKVEEAYQAAFKHWAVHKYGVTEIDGEELEERIDASEAHGFYYLVIFENDLPKARYKMHKSGAFTEVPIEPKAEGGYRRILNLLSSIIGFVRGLVEF